MNCPRCAKVLGIDYDSTLGVKLIGCAGCGWHLLFIANYVRDLTPSQRAWLRQIERALDIAIERTLVAMPDYPGGEMDGRD